MGSDAVVDNWSSGRFFSSPSVTLANGDEHYRSIFYAPVASFHRGNLLLAFATGERHNLGYAGDATVADENRFYVVEDLHPTGPSAFAATLTDANLTDVTSLGTDNDSTDSGYLFTLAEGEKFVTDITVFAGQVIVGTYTPLTGADVCLTASGQAFLHIFELASGRGYFDTPTDPPSEERRTYVGGGFPTSPEVTVAKNPDDDVIIIRTSEGPKVFTMEAPPRTDPRGSYVYWKEQM